RRLLEGRPRHRRVRRGLSGVGESERLTGEAMTDLDALTAACLDDPDDEGRLAVLGDWLEERGDARVDAVRSALRWRAAVSGARAEEGPDDCEDFAALLLTTARAPDDAERVIRWPRITCTSATWRKRSCRPTRAF